MALPDASSISCLGGLTARANGARSSVAIFITMAWACRAHPRASWITSFDVKRIVLQPHASNTRSRVLSASTCSGDEWNARPSSSIAIRRRSPACFMAKSSRYRLTHTCWPSTMPELSSAISAAPRPTTGLNENCSENSSAARKRRSRGDSQRSTYRPNVSKHPAILLTLADAQSAATSLDGNFALRIVIKRNAKRIKHRRAAKFGTRGSHG